MRGAMAQRPIAPHTCAVSRARLFRVQWMIKPVKSAANTAVECLVVGAIFHGCFITLGGMVTPPLRVLMVKVVLRTVLFLVEFGGTVFVVRSNQVATAACFFFFSGR